MIEYAVQSLQSAFPALLKMVPAQWAHTGDPGVECAPNWGLYQEMDQRGGLVLIVATDDTGPIGYMAGFIYPHPNSRLEKTAEIKTYYVKKGRAHVLNTLAEKMLAELAFRGACKIKAWTHADHSAARLWELHGFEISDIGLTLPLKKPEGAKYA